VIAQFDNEDAGVLATSVEKGIGWIDQLYLALGYVGLGIGAELLNYPLSVLPRPVRIWTFQENDRAIRFYEHYGFKTIKYTNGEDNEEQCPDVLYEHNESLQ
jgi:GNAT superfamily N-acetyltransferase